MKYLKLFTEKKFDNIEYGEIDRYINEIKSLSYILEDEGCEVTIERKLHKQPTLFGPEKGQIEIFGISIIIEIRNSKKDIQQKEFFREWSDRVYEICHNAKMQLPPYLHISYEPSFIMSIAIKTNRRINLEMK